MKNSGAPSKKEDDSDHNSNKKSDNSEESEKSSRKEKWKVVDTLQESSAVLPILAVTLWIGWMGFLVYATIGICVWGTTIVKMIYFGLCTLSLVLPPDFPKAYGKPVWGRWIMLHAARYFGLKTTVEDPQALADCFTQTKKATTGAVMFAKEPHDVLPYSIFCFADALSHRILPSNYINNTNTTTADKSSALLASTEDGMAGLVTGAVFKLPIIRQVYTWMGTKPVNKQTFRSRLENGQAFCFIPGGAEEVLMLAQMQQQKQQPQPSQSTNGTISNNNNNNNNNCIPLYLKHRKGFVKMALDTGSPIVPVFAFGLDKSYTYLILPGLTWISTQLLGFVPVLFVGRFGIPFGIPKPTKISVVIGTPILIPKFSDLQEQQEEEEVTMSDLVEKYHQMYVEELEALYERHKHDNEGYSHRKLMIF